MNTGDSIAPNLTFPFELGYSGQQTKCSFLRWWTNLQFFIWWCWWTSPNGIEEVHVDYGGCGGCGDSGKSQKDTAFSKIADNDNQQISNSGYRRTEALEKHPHTEIERLEKRNPSRQIASHCAPVPWPSWQLPLLAMTFLTIIPFSEGVRPRIPVQIPSNCQTLLLQSCKLIETLNSHSRLYVYEKHTVARTIILYSSLVSNRTASAPATIVCSSCMNRTCIANGMLYAMTPTAAATTNCPSLGSNRTASASATTVYNRLDARCVCHTDDWTVPTNWFQLQLSCMLPTTPRPSEAMRRRHTSYSHRLQLCVHHSKTIEPLRRRLQPYILRSATTERLHQYIGYICYSHRLQPYTHHSTTIMNKAEWQGLFMSCDGLLVFLS